MEDRKFEPNLVVANNGMSQIYLNMVMDKKYVYVAAAEPYFKSPCPADIILHHLENQKLHK
jgi:hypothetical protein